MSDLSGVPDLADVPDLAPSCSDGIRDGLETDVDCGGPACPRCALGKYCATNTDCSSGVCTPMPQAPGEPGGVCTS